MFHHMVDIPLFLATNHFLSYQLCPPSVKEWQKKLDVATPCNALPAFPWLEGFIPTIINPAKNYATTPVLLAVMVTQLLDNTIPDNPTPPGGPALLQSSRAPLHLFHVHGSPSQAESPSSQIPAPGKHLTTHPHSWDSPSWLPPQHSNYIFLLYTTFEWHTG